VVGTRKGSIGPARAPAEIPVVEAMAKAEAMNTV
jgi:hypothetical protein